MAAVKGELAALREAVRQLHGFIITELDRHPLPVVGYLTGADIQAAAHRASPTIPEGYDEDDEDDV